MSLTIRAHTLALEPHRPLHARVPTRDDDGQLLGDFMMLFPGLRDLPQTQFLDRLAGMQAVLGQFREVVFVDLNVPLNLLWVSVRPRPRVILEIAGAIQFHLPEALLVGHSARRGQT